MASCAPPEREQNELNELNELLGHDAATQTELTMDAIAKLETFKLTVDERRLKHNEQCRESYAAKKRKLEQLMIANANLEQAIAAAMAAPTPPLPPLPLPAPPCPSVSQLFGSVVV